MGQKPLPCARENRKMKIELVLFQIYTKLFDAQKLMADIYILHLIRWHEIIHNHNIQQTLIVVTSLDPSRNLCLRCGKLLWVPSTKLKEASRSMITLETLTGVTILDKDNDKSKSKENK